MGSTADIVRGVFRAYETKDRAAIESLIADDFHFTSPMDNRLDRAAYFEICWPDRSIPHEAPAGTHKAD